MHRRVLVTAAVVLAASGLATLAAAQEATRPPAAKPPAEAAKPAETSETPETRGTPGATLRVQVVVARFQGEKKIASLPYTFIAVTSRPVRMRMGVDTPIAMATVAGDGPRPPASIQYKNVGTNIDCTAFARSDGRYQLRMSIESSSALGGEGGAAGAPLFRRFDTSFDPVLRDGQSVQAIASTDPVTGEVVKIDVTLNVMN